MRHGQKGYYSLADLPQGPSLDGAAFGAGWWEVDEILKFYPGQFIVVTGKAGVGKSTVMLNILAKLAIERGLHSFLYVPENEKNLFAKLRKLWKDEARFEYFCQAQCFVQTALSNSYDEPPHTIEWILDQAVVAVREDSVELVYIDPWNEIERAKPKDELLTDYIGYCIGLMKQFCRVFNVIVIIVAHPTKAVNENGGRLPTLADIEGSMNWYNKADNGLIITRDEDKGRIISAKVREAPEAGRLGVCHFTVDPRSGIFTPVYGGVSS
jgi:twinkle protein